MAQSLPTPDWRGSARPNPRPCVQYSTSQVQYSYSCSVVFLLSRQRCTPHSAHPRPCLRSAVGPTRGSIWLDTRANDSSRRARFWWERSWGRLSISQTCTLDCRVSNFQRFQVIRGGGGEVKEMARWLTRSVCLLSGMGLDDVYAFLAHRVRNI